MNNCIFYFTGTGNSLKIAKDLSGKLSGFKIQSIANLKNAEDKYDKVGFVFPVYAWGPPVIVTRFINSISSRLGDTYIFAVANYRKEPGAALNYLSKILRNNGLILSSAFGVNMPGNHIANYEIDTQNEQDKKDQEWCKLLPKIVQIINEKRQFWGIQPKLIDKFYRTGFLYNIASKQFAIFDKNFSVNEKCNNCKICSKICPVKNIEMIDNKPRWKHKCEQCLACLNWCSQVAIEYGHNTIGRKRYHHPEIRIKDMLNE